MSLFHSGMNHWQRQWLSDRLHKKNQDIPLAESPAPTATIKTRRPRPLKAKQKHGDQQSSA